MALDVSGTICDRFDAARSVLDMVIPRRRRVGRSYQGFIKALMKYNDSLLPALCLLVADAGFTGFDLLRQLHHANVFFLIRVGANVTLLRKLGYTVMEHGNTVYLWPKNRRSDNPFVLRLICVQPVGGKKPIFLITNVLDHDKLSDETAAAIYQMRWGVEVFFRSLKQTLQRRKMRSAAPRQAALELHWSIVGLLLLGLVSVKAITARGKDPLCWSVALALRVVRRAMQKPPAYRTLVRDLADATKDNYTRSRSKKARNWAHKKNDPPPGEPKLRIANEKEVRQAQQLTTQQEAA